MTIRRNTILLPITRAEMVAACEIVRVREALERIDKKLEKDLRPKRKRKTSSK